MIEQDPSTLRRVYFDAWQKALQHKPLSAMESMIVDIIERHPEYQPLFANEQNFQEMLNEKFALDGNPFFHLALHITIAEQVSTNRPKGIRPIYQKMLKKYGDKTLAEHKLMDCLAKVLVDSYQKNEDASEEAYLAALSRLQ
jgi:uncharacterized protein DUF1841